MNTIYIGLVNLRDLLDGAFRGFAASAAAPLIAAALVEPGKPQEHGVRIDRWVVQVAHVGSLRGASTVYYWRFQVATVTLMPGGVPMQPDRLEAAQAKSRRILELVERHIVALGGATVEGAVDRPRELVALDGAPPDWLRCTDGEWHAATAEV